MSHNTNTGILTAAEARAITDKARASAAEEIAAELERRNKTRDAKFQVRFLEGEYVHHVLDRHKELTLLVIQECVGNDFVHCTFGVFDGNPRDGFTLKSLESISFTQLELVRANRPRVISSHGVETK